MGRNRTHESQSTLRVVAVAESSYPDGVGLLVESTDAHGDRLGMTLSLDDAEELGRVLLDGVAHARKHIRET